MTRASQMGAEHQTSSSTQKGSETAKSTNVPRYAKKVVTPNSHPNAGTTPSRTGGDKFGSGSSGACAG